MTFVKLSATFFISSLLVATNAFSQAPQAPNAVTNQIAPALEATGSEKSETSKFTTAPLLDPNSATLEQLKSISGLSEAGAQAVIDKRPFATPSELHAAIGGADMNAEDLFSVYSAMFVKVDLNTGANEDFQLVPTTLSARKLAHEFEEYRPYSSMDDFTREMKKYVSDEEVAFLERYVKI